MLQFRERSTCVVQIRIRHRRVFAHDIHAVQFAGMYRVHNLDDGESWFGVEFCVPQCFEATAHRIIADRLIIRKHHRDEPDIRCALNVVLPAQRMQAGAGTPDLSSEQRE